MSTVADIERLAQPIIERHACRLVQTTFRRESSGHVLRLLVERKDADPERGSGVDLGLCASISRELSARLDVDGGIDHPYVLEVSSAGLERPLVRLDDYARFAGREAAITTARAIDGRRRFRGTIEGIFGEAVRLRCEGSVVFDIPVSLVEKAHLVFDFDKARRSRGDE